MMANELEKKSSREREMNNAINQKEEDIAAMRLSKRERSKVAAELQKKLQKAQFANKLLKNQVSEKMKAERYLLAELEAQHMHVQDNAHPESLKAVKAQIRANRDLSGIL